MSDGPQILIEPTRAPVDIPLDVQLTGFASGQKITVQAQTTDGKGMRWKSQIIYETNADGRVNLNKQKPLSGKYTNADAMNLIWSMLPLDDVNNQAMFRPPDDLSPITVTVDALVNGEVITSAQATRLYLADGVERIVVRENGLFGTLFLPAGNGPHPAITIVSGSGGGILERYAAQYASHGYAGFALAYFNYESLPKILVDIPLEYFETAIHYLQAFDGIDGGRLAITGRSRGGELSLLLASIFPQYKVVIADSPSSIVFGGFGYDPEEGNKPAWLYNGKAILFMEDDDEPDSEIFNYQAEYAKRGEAIPGTPGFLELMRLREAAMKKAEIPVENINGAVLMISGEDDQMWPSVKLANIAMNRLQEHHFDKPYIHLSYPQAGHNIEPPYQPTTITNLKHPVDGSLYALGGSPEANYRANVDSWNKKLDFLKSHL